jgi:hypothetical protein
MRFTITIMALFASIATAAPGNPKNVATQNGNGNNVPGGSVVPRCLAKGDSRFTITLELVFVLT